MISKAQKIDSDEEVEGVFDGNNKILTSHYGGELYRGSDGTKKWLAKYFFEEVDPSTLKHSFDNGKTWRTEEEINSDLLAMDTLRSLKDK